MKTLSIKALFCLSLLLSTFVWAQNTFFDSMNTALKQISTPESEENFIKFKTSEKINPSTVFEEYKTAFGLPEFDNMTINISFADDLGFTHHNYLIQTETF